MKQLNCCIRYAHLNARIQSSQKHGEGVIVFVDRKVCEDELLSWANSKLSCPQHSQNQDPQQQQGFVLYHFH